ncbi:MAG TPA: hypothetical protein VGE07_30165, partial [Herpetosiphonaceae bacterium]
MNPIVRRHQSARAYCLRRLKEPAGPASWQDWLAAAAWHELLAGIESVAEADLASAAELDALLEMAAAQAEARLLAPGMLAQAPLKRADPAAVAAQIAAAGAEFR